MATKFKSIPIKEYQKRREDPSDDTKCGFGSCTPRWLQWFADPKVYLVVFCTLGVLQGAYFTYFVGVISTLEKRYAFESKITGLIMIADNLSPIFTSILVGYFGGKAHKPRLIAGGMLLVISSCFLSAVPYFIYGPALHLLSNEHHVSSKPSELEFCDSEVKKENCDTAKMHSTAPAVTILFLANFLNGFGYTAFYTIGTPYLDDNVKKKNSPIYFGAMAGLRIFGPALGFLLSSFCLRFYEDPFHDPGISQLNPRWVGAWWMGFVILGFSLLIFTAILALFPRQLPERFRSDPKSKKKGEEEEEMPKLKDFPRAIKKLLRNPILVCHIISVTFQINGFAGYFVFMPKYMESQYQQSASSASLFSGATGIGAMLAGIILGGCVIKVYKPRPRYLTGYMVIVEIFSVLGLLISIFLGCPQVQLPGSTLQSNETLNLYNDCNSNCHCTRGIFEPVCSIDGESMFFSPCFAGCLNSTATSVLSSALNSAFQNTTQVFDDCRCLAGPNSTFVSSEASSSLCTFTCNMFVPYIIMLSISKFISSTARVGNTLITFRCVDSKDKSFALGTFGSVIAAFAFIPYPLIYGALTDSACLVWEESCSKTGNCWLYDREKFRNYLHGMSMILITIGICFDGVVFLLSDRLRNFYGEEDEDSGPIKRVDHWIKEEEEEDIIFTKRSENMPMTEFESII